MEIPILSPPRSSPSTHAAGEGDGENARLERAGEGYERVVFTLDDGILRYFYTLAMAPGIANTTHSKPWGGMDGMDGQAGSSLFGSSELMIFVAQVD